jgi:REP element-mobilizing transposase RayT
MKQLALKLPQRGGKRKGAGRKRQAPRPRVSHKARAHFDKPSVVHVTLRVTTNVWNLRTKRCFKAIGHCFADARERLGLRIIEFAVLGNHLHLLVEADSSLALSRGMQGLNVRIARALNRVMQRRGTVFDDHYHAQLLPTPTQVVKAIAYIVGNHEHHYGGSRGIDPCSSLACDEDRVLATPTTWLLRVGWRRAHQNAVDVEMGRDTTPANQGAGCGRLESAPTAPCLQLHARSF